MLLTNKASDFQIFLDVTQKAKSFVFFLVAKTFLLKLQPSHSWLFCATAPKVQRTLLLDINMEFQFHNS